MAKLMAAKMMSFSVQREHSTVTDCLMRYLRSTAHDVDCRFVPWSDEPRTGSLTSRKINNAQITPKPGVNCNMATITVQLATENISVWG